MRGPWFTSGRENLLPFFSGLARQSGSLSPHPVCSPHSQVPTLRPILRPCKNDRGTPLVMLFPSLSTQSHFSRQIESFFARYARSSGPACSPISAHLPCTPVGPGASRCPHTACHSHRVLHLLSSSLPGMFFLISPLSKTLSRANLPPTSPITLSMTKPSLPAEASIAL